MQIWNTFYIAHRDYNPNIMVRLYDTGNALNIKGLICFSSNPSLYYCNRYVDGLHFEC